MTVGNQTETAMLYSHLKSSRERRNKMTICVSVKVAEGLVLAADSAVTLQGSIKTPQGRGTGIIQQFNYANKVTRFKDYPIGVMSWGLASVNDRSIQSLIMEFEHSFPAMEIQDSFTVLGIANKLKEFIEQRYNAAFPSSGQRPSLGMLVGGYSHNEFFADEYTYEYSSSKAWQLVRPPKPDSKPSFGADWFGQTDALTRLIKGYDVAALNELVKRGADKQTVEKWVNDAVGELPLVFDGMPLQDAIDFANYSVQVVIGRFRFAAGPPLCGGDIDIAVVTPTVFRWAQRKMWAINE